MSAVGRREGVCGWAPKCANAANVVSSRDNCVGWGDMPEMVYGAKVSRLSIVVWRQSV